MRNERSKPAGLKRILFSLAAVVAVLTLAYFGIAGYTAERLTHPERKALTTSPAQYGLKYEDVQFASAVDGVPLKGWFIDSPGTKTILMIHGRNGVRDDAEIGMLEVANALVRRGYDVLTFDLRAHGESGGTRYSLGQWEVRDLTGALDYLKGRGVKEIGAIGFSMGAATQLLAAPDHPEIRAIVMDAPFADLSALLDVQLPKASGLPGFFNPGVILMVRTIYGVDLLDNKPERSVTQLGDRPLLLIHGTADELIPVEHAYALQKAGAGDPNFQTWIVPGSKHVRSYKDHPQEYLSRVITFFDRYLE